MLLVGYVDRKCWEGGVNHDITKLLKDVGDEELIWKYRHDNLSLDTGGNPYVSHYNQEKREIKICYGAKDVNMDNKHNRKV